MRRPAYRPRKRRASWRAKFFSRRIIREVIRERDSRGHNRRVYSCAREVNRYLPARVRVGYPWRRWAWHGPQRTLAR